MGIAGPGTTALVAWVNASPRSKALELTNAEHVFGLRRQLGLLCLGMTFVLKSTGPHAQTPCSEVMDAYGLHASKCYRHLHTPRHDRIRDLLANYARTGYTTHVEQQVCDEGSSQRTKRPLRRANIHATSLSGTQYWMDVKIATPMPGDKDAIYFQLSMHEDGKVHQYEVSGITPIIFTSLGHLGPKGVACLQSLCEARAQRICAAPASCIS